MAKDESINKVRDIYNPDNNELAQSIIRDLFNYFDDRDLEDFVNFIKAEYGIEEVEDDNADVEEEVNEEYDHGGIGESCLFIQGHNPQVCARCNDKSCLNSNAYELSQKK